MADRLHPPAPAGLTRRAMLGRTALAGAAAAAASLVPAAGLFAAQRDDASPSSGALPEVETPAEALKELAAGNLRFVDGKPVGPHRSMSRVHDVAPKQHPFASLLSCADSRVPVEILFDQGFGDLFVCRAAGNIVTPEMLASLEYGAAVLGTKAIVVLGHSSCGAVKATIEGGAAPGQISTLYQHIQPAVDGVAMKSKAGEAPDTEAVAAENVRLQVHLLRRASPVIAGLVRANKLAVVGGMYDVATGRVTMLAG